MPQTSCFTQLFQPNTPFINGQNVLEMQAGHLGKRFIPNKPFIPIAGCDFANHIPDTIANNVLFSQTFIDFFEESRQASINEVQDLVGSEFLSELYQGYLFKETFEIPQNYNRYIQNAALVFNFWQNANPAWTTTEYFNALNDLALLIMQQADKSFYIPPGQYDFLAASALGLNLTAWETANPQFTGFIIVEFYQ